MVDRSTFIRESVEDVQVTLVLGGLLTVLIVFLFLNSWRSTVITGLALPVSVISTFIVMKALGFTLNILTLMGLSLAIGLLIDDAIVVRENIVRHMHAGADHFTAAREATAEIGLAVMATTFTIIAVFVPVAFMGGIIGRFFFQFGITVGFAVLVSLYVSFTLDPMLSSRWYDPAADPRVQRSWFGAAAGKCERPGGPACRSVLAGVLGWSLRHRWAVIAAGDRWRSFPASRSSASWARRSCRTPIPGQFQVSYKADSGHQPGPLRGDRAGTGSARSGATRRWPTPTSRSAATAGKPINEGSIFVRLKPRKTRKHYQHAQDGSSPALARFRAIRTSIEEADQIGGDVKPIQISVRGHGPGAHRRR